jgi:hypothetical protein
MPSDIPTGHHVRGDGDDAVIMELHSNLSHDAARAGLNFLSPAIHALVRRELLMREEGAAIDEDRLFGNSLSSMPLTFNLFGPLALDLNLATAALRQLLPGFVHEVTGFAFEHSPGRRQYRFLNDGTAFDTGPAARLRDRYDESSRTVGLFVDPDSPMLRSLALEQLWREHMLAQLSVEQGITPRAMFIAIGPRLNRRVMAAFRVYENELIDADDHDANRAPFIANDFPTMLGAAVEGVGLAQVPAPLATSAVTTGKLVHVLEQFAPMTPGVFLYYPGHRQIMPKLRAFIDHVKGRSGPAS